MKKLFFLLPLLGAVVLSSCGKEDDPAPDKSVLKNAIVWTQEKPSRLRLIDETWADSLFIGAYTKNGMMSLQIDFKGTGTYKLPSTGDAIYYILNEDGSIRSNYDLDRQSTFSEVVVTAFNPETKFVKGTFKCALKKSYMNSDTPDQEEIQITEGIFEGVINKI
ncbi:hypothetical protein TH61_10570 [Rufibacter sp. DG15C]|uniref:DUF6252 family protein n=1 Tax=Rufibacter sp. DG15C TaxID=1379909 RepID=UPI00078B7812|nr:DUF6252 family protein [Rufibacter sp. DG15C]AMM51527.1 hypothetical protein TH61_10570 [Rufibacter sp. DG15C]